MTDTDTWAETPADWYITADQQRTIAAQITMGVILSISGGRIHRLRDGIELPVSSGFRVRVHLTPADTYTVERVMVRGAREYRKGQRTDVHTDQVSDAAYYAGMFRSYDADEWPTVTR